MNTKIRLRSQRHMTKKEFEMKSNTFRNAALILLTLGALSLTGCGGGGVQPISEQTADPGTQGSTTRKPALSEPTRAEPARPATPSAGPAQAIEPSSIAPEAPGPIESLDPLSVPVELVGTWHGGAGDSYYYTFDSHGRYRLEHARSGWREEGAFIVDGQTITFSPRGGNERTSAWEIQPLLVTLLFIDGFSYVKA